MKCLSFGYLVLILIAICLVSGLTPMPSIVSGVASSAAIIWFVVSFFVKCDK